MSTDNLTLITRAAERYTYEYVLEDVADPDLYAWGDAGTVVLVSRCERRIRRAVAQAAGTGAADREDLQQAAVLALLETIQLDSERGGGAADIYSYAHPRIRHALAEANRTVSAMPVPVPSHKRFWAAMTAMDHDPVRAREWSALQRLTGYELQDAADGGDLIAASILDDRIAYWERSGHDVAERMAETGRGLERADFDVIHAALMYTSVEAPADTEDSALTVGDAIADDGAGSSFASVEDRLTVAALLSTLPDRERDIVASIYGIDGPALTAAEVAEKHGISRTRVVSIHTAALKRLAREAA